jgi:hypothetical protein
MSTDPWDLGLLSPEEHLRTLPWAVRDARGADHMHCATEEEAAAKARAWNAETDPHERVDDGAYPFAAARREA